MKKFVSIIIALFAVLMIQAQQISLDNAFVQNTCVVQQHIDVGTSIQPTFQNIYITQNPVNVTNVNVSNFSLIMPTIPVAGLNRLAYTSYIDYRRGVGLINSEFNTTIKVTNNAANAGYKWMNVQRYWTSTIS